MLTLFCIGGLIWLFLWWMDNIKGPERRARVDAMLSGYGYSAETKRLVKEAQQILEMDKKITEACLLEQEKCREARLERRRRTSEHKRANARKVEEMYFLRCIEKHTKTKKEKQHD